MEIILDSDDIKALVQAQYPTVKDGDIIFSQKDFKITIKVSALPKPLARAVPTPTLEPKPRPPKRKLSPEEENRLKAEAEVKSGSMVSGGSGRSMSAL